MHGIGVQGHIGAPVGAHLRHAFDILGGAGLPVWITELDFESIDDNIKGDDLEVYMREAYAHEAIRGMVFWGFWESGMNRKNSYIVNKDWVPGAACQRLRMLLQEWTTRDVTVLTDAEGRAMFRGFPGEYEVTIAWGGKSVQVPVLVSEDVGGADCTIVLS